MGIAADFLTIVLGVILGNTCKKIIRANNFFVFGVSIMIISISGFIENGFKILNGKIESIHIILVVLSVIIGTIIGETLKLYDKLINFTVTDEKVNSIVETSIFFGIGGLQICGPILLATTGDSSQLFVKCLLDFPFALMFGAAYGKKVALSAFPVMCLQTVILGISYYFRGFFNDLIVSQLCAVGYVILFFSGYNISVGEAGKKIETINMLPCIVVNLFINIFLGWI